MVGTLSAIHIYPVKSCRGVAVESAEVSVSGLVGDRRFQVVDPEGAPITQRQQPTLATVQPSLIGGGLRLEAEGARTIQVAMPTGTDRTATSLIGVPVESADAGDEAAAFFSDVLGVPARLVAIADETGYAVPIPGIEMRASWADAASVLIANEASHAWLADRADEAFGMDRFRANLTVSGPAPFEEDTWRDVSIGDARFGYGFAWPRCAIPQVDQLDGSRHKEPAKVLKAHRWCTEAPDVPDAMRPLFEGNALFGIGCSVLDAGSTVSVGDAVSVNDTGARIIAGPD